MKWVLIPLVWLLALALALAVLWRLWRGQNLVLGGKISPRVLRMVVLVLVLLGVGVEKGPAETLPPLTGGKEAGQEPSSALLPAVLKGNKVSLDTAAQAQRELTAFKQAFASLPSAGSPATPEEVTRLIEQLDAADFRSRQQATERLEGLLPGVRPELEKALRRQPPLELRVRLEKLLEKADLFRRVPELAHAVTPTLGKLVTADLEARGKPSPPPRCADLLQAVDELESRVFADHWVSAYLWRKAALVADRDQLATLFARLHQQARLANALIRARAEVKPLDLGARAWMSKAGPGREIRAHEADLLAAVRRLYATSDTGTWQKDAVASFAVADGSPAPTLIRGGERQLVQPGTAVRFNRLDLLETARGDRPLVLEHPWLGRLTLPPVRVVAIWDLADGLSNQARATVERTVADALEGNEAAALRLEQALPLMQHAARERVAAKPTAPGAARLRLILALFEDSTVPASQGSGAK